MKAIELELSQSESPAPRLDGVVIGRLVDLAEPASPRVSFPGAPEEGLLARTLTLLTTEAVGQPVALLFEGGNPARPLVMGRVQNPEDLIAPAPTVERDGERLELTAEREIVLRCGKASITLTRAGKVIIRGAYLSCRSSGVHRIKGGSVQIN